LAGFAERGEAYLAVVAVWGFWVHS
jgi:hypothetical protein